MCVEGRAQQAFLGPDTLAGGSQSIRASPMDAWGEGHSEQVLTLRGVEDADTRNSGSEVSLPRCLPWKPRAHNQVQGCSCQQRSWTALWAQSDVRPR